MHSEFDSALIRAMSDFKFPEKLRNTSVKYNENVYWLIKPRKLAAVETVCDTSKAWAVKTAGVWKKKCMHIIHEDFVRWCYAEEKNKDNLKLPGQNTK